MNDIELDQLTVVILLRHRRTHGKKKYWVHPLNLLRPTIGEHLKVEIMYSNYPQKFFEYTRMNPEQFDKMLNLTENYLQKMDTNYRLAIPPRQRLFIALRYLVTGDSLRTISVSFSIGKTTVQEIVKQVNETLWTQLSPIWLKVPTKDEWNSIVEDFDDLWNFPNCLGAIDGKHVMMQAPPNSGSLFFNYKSFFSVVLLATCDAHYRFTTVDIGGYGRQSDGGIFANSGLGKAIDNGNLALPDKKILPNTLIKQPCTFVGDDAFGLSEMMMKPFADKSLANPEKRVFNYRLSRARRIIENVFGILANRFRIYKRSITADPENVVLLVKATVVLHNFLRTEEMAMLPEKRRYCPNALVDHNDESNGEWRQTGVAGALGAIRPCTINNSTISAKQMRDNLASYFMGPGQVNFQNERAFV